MNFARLQPFLIQAAESSNLKIKKAAESLNDQMLQAQEAEEVAEPSLQSNSPLGGKTKDQIDLTLDKWMPDMVKKDPTDSGFGKKASSFSSDVKIESLPKSTRADILKFSPHASGKDMVVLYGMVVDELLPKTDHHNYEMAKEHIKKDLKTLGKKAMADKFQSKVDNKYILLMNDCVTDGHHMIALAQALNISCSLKVLDLTPLRFQQVKTAQSLLDYVIRNHRRAGIA